MNPILEVKGLRVRYGSGRNALNAVDGIDLSLPANATLGLVGESGCGKSTVARALLGLQPVLEGSIMVDGKECSRQRDQNTRAYRRTVQMVFQDPYSSLNPRMTIEDILGEAVSLQAESRVASGERRRKCLRALDLVGLPSSALERFPHQFSGGQRQRVAIARALIVEPRIIVNDEVTSALDVSTQATVLNLLKSLQQELGLSYILISHDLSVVRIMSDVVAVMYLGRIVETAATEQLFANPVHPYTRALIESAPRMELSARPVSLIGEIPNPSQPPNGCRFHTRCPVGPLARAERGICLEQDPQAVRRQKPHVAACHFA